MIDSHQHFWQISRDDCEWPGADLPALHRDFLPEHYAAAVSGLALEGSVLVQSQTCDSDTDFLLRIADTEPTVRAVVGWVDLTSNRAGERLRQLREHPKFRGIRPMLQAIERDDWILGRECDAALASAQQLGLRFDALIQPRHLPIIAELARRYPELDIVLDHAAKPDIARGAFAQWAEDILALAEHGNVSCKLSGLPTQVTPEQYSQEQQPQEQWPQEQRPQEQRLHEQRPQEQYAGDEIFLPYVAHLFRAFGVTRLMWGSDWPVCTLRTSLVEWYERSARLLARCAGDDTAADARQKIFSGNAKHFYQLDGLASN